MLFFYLYNEVLGCSFLVFCLCCLCIGECLVVGQSHFKTFDNKFFTFTGRCQYLLARDCTDSGFSVIIENVQVLFYILKFIYLLSKLYENIFFCHFIGTSCSSSPVFWLLVFCFSVQTIRMLCAHAQWRSACPLLRAWQWSWSMAGLSLSTAWTSRPQCTTVCYFGRKVNKIYILYSLEYQTVFWFYTDNRTWSISGKLPKHYTVTCYILLFDIFLLKKKIHCTFSPFFILLHSHTHIYTYKLLLGLIVDHDCSIIINFWL